MKSGDRNGRKLKFPSSALWPSNVTGENASHHIVWGWRVCSNRGRFFLCMISVAHHLSIPSAHVPVQLAASLRLFSLTEQHYLPQHQHQPPHETPLSGVKSQAWGLRLPHLIRVPKKDDLTTQLYCVRAEIRQWAGVFSEVTTASKTTLHSNVWGRTLQPIFT